MRSIWSYAILLIGLLCMGAMQSADDFRSDQKRYARVRTAYANHWDHIKDRCQSKGMDLSSVKLYLRAFKLDQQLELWISDADHNHYALIERFDVCRSSGELGPKRKQGDYQVPEGFYHIDRFNPASSYHLSLGINYPNRSDRILSDPTRPGGDIFIHGDCVTIGCIPIEDEFIEALYVYCVEAKNAGQETIPVTIFPFRPGNQHQRLMDACQDPTTKELWKDLSEAYVFFEKHRTLPAIRFLADGDHQIGP